MPAYRRKSKSLRKGALVKVGMFAAHCPAEAQCRGSYTDAVERHFRASVLDALPPQYDSLLQQIEDEDAGSSYDMSAQRSAARAR